MDGSTLDLIVIPIVVVISLAIWLTAVFYAASHPQWKWQRVPRPADLAKIIPLPRPEPAGQREAADAAHPRWAAAARTDAGHPAA